MNKKHLTWTFVAWNLVLRVRAYADLNSHVGQDMFRLHQSNLITHDLVCAASQCLVIRFIVPAFMRGRRKRVLLRCMGEDAQCCKWVTHVSYLLRLAPSPRRAEKAAPRDSSGPKCSDATETTIGPSGSAEPNSIHPASNGTTCGSGSNCQEGSFFGCLSGTLIFLMPFRFSAGFGSHLNHGLPSILETPRL